jgi:hypothetical protein
MSVVIIPPIGKPYDWDTLSVKEKIQVQEYQNEVKSWRKRIAKKEAS